MNDKTRNTDFSITQQLINKFGVDKIHETWKKYGMYTGAKVLSKEAGHYISPYVLRYMSNKFDWVRIVTNPNLPFVKGILNGKVAADYYKHVRFKNIPGIPTKQ